MLIDTMLVNRIPYPLGFSLGVPRFSYKVRSARGKRQESACLRVALDEQMTRLLYDSERSTTIDSLCCAVELRLEPRTRYWWDVAVWSDAGETAQSAPAWFETGKMDEPWQARWITGSADGNQALYRSFSLAQKPVRARVYCTGLGLYELYINSKKVSDELLAPGCNAYDRWIQVQTYDVDDFLSAGTNDIAVLLGDGWYKGRFGFKNQSELYGDTQALLLELRLTWADGSETVIGTDADWQAGESQVRFADMYDGEVFDATLDDSARTPAALIDALGYTRLYDRLSQPVRVVQRIAPAALLHTPAGETVIDLGQEITGYLEFQIHAPRGARLQLFYGEILQDGNFFNENLRTAKQEFTYIADGGEAVVRPHFTFYGFRYVKLVGFDHPAIEQFTGCVVHTDIPVTAAFHCANPKVNRLFENALWGQRGNFLDVPTDCPQRDERLGWTGDAQVFSGTAMYQMECAAFFDKYLHDMRAEQEKLGGSVPYVVPMVVPGEASCAWADAAVIIPFNRYLFYGDTQSLRGHYPLMRDWVEWLYRNDERSGGRRLWETGFHYADWLALDTKDGSTTGGTDPYFIASTYYYYSVSLLIQVAQVLGLVEDVARYTALQQQIFDAFQREYFTPAGRLAQTTQTAYICVLFMGLAKPEQVPLLKRLLNDEIVQAKALRTGFVGTAYICRTLSLCGLTGLAYDLFLRETYPSWLYEVNMGATTIWERWNAVLPNGKLSDTTMNSLNHYAYGSVMEWVYRDVAGLAPVLSAPGFRRALMRPLPDERLGSADLRFESPMGAYQSRWAFDGDAFAWHIEIPFGAQAKAVFPFADADVLSALYPRLGVQREQGETIAELDAGCYDFRYPIMR